MFRTLALIAITPLALATVSCASDDGGGASSATTPAAPTQEATPVDATPAIAPPDQEAYRLSIAGLGTVQETCTYLPDGALADCTERGIYKLEPPLENDDASCVVGLSGGAVKPEYVLCSNPDGGESKFFVIQP